MVCDHSEDAEKEDGISLIVREVQNATARFFELQRVNCGPTLAGASALRTDLSSKAQRAFLESTFTFAHSQNRAVVR